MKTVFRKIRLYFFHSSAAGAGFSLVEMVVYIAVFSMIMTIILQMSMQVQMAGGRVRTSNELRENLSQSLVAATALVRESDSLNAGQSVFDVHPGKLTLLKDSQTSVLETYTKQVTVGGTPVTITKLRLTQGANPPIDLSSDHVSVTDFRVLNLSQSGDPHSIQFFLEFSSINPSADPAFSGRLSARISVTARAEL